MGTNKRYAAQIDARMDQRISEDIMLGEPRTLTNEELELTIQPLTRTPIARPVVAWVRYPDGPVKVYAELVAWTPRACAIRWTTHEGKEHRAWVWASAVEPREESEKSGAVTGRPR